MTSPVIEKAQINEQNFMQSSVEALIEAGWCVVAIPPEDLKGADPDTVAGGLLEWSKEWIEGEDAA